MEGRLAGRALSGEQVEQGRGVRRDRHASPDRAMSLSGIDLHMAKNHDGIVRFTRKNGESYK
jgi:hypothetical protein